jgi:alkylhydroperoxidase family enzyme
MAARTTREPRIPLMDESDTRRWLEWSEDEPLPLHARLLAHFPVTGKTWMEYLAAAEDQGKLDPRWRAEIAWWAAREDRAWYAQSVAWQRLRAMGWTEEMAFAEPSGAAGDPARESVVRLTKRLTASPQTIVDEDIAAVRRHFSPEETAEIVHHITLAAFFNRLTEAAGLPTMAP